MRIDILKKIVTLCISILFLNGCVDATAFLGPAITAGTSGNIYQASLSYGTNRAVLKTTGKAPIEHVIQFLDPKKEHKGDLSSILKNKAQNINSNAKEIKLKIKRKQDVFFTIVKKIHNKQKLKIDNSDQFILY